jgi:hypothetical protein
VKQNTFLLTLQVIGMIEAAYQQHLAWQDAAEARDARRRAEAKAAEQARAMLAAHPSGALGRGRLNDVGALYRSGLL